MNQESIDYFSKKVEELIDGIDRGDFSKEIIPDKYKWEHLLGLFILKDSLDGGEELFRQLYDLSIRSAENYIRQKAERGEKIIVAFQSYSAAQWPAVGVYRAFEKDLRFETKVLVSPLADRDKESIIDSYNNTLKWFLENGYRTVEGMDKARSRFLGWEDFGKYPDVLYQLSSWFNNMAENQWFTRLPLRCLVAYIPYGMYIADSKDGSYAKQLLYNKEMFNVMWRIYCDSADSFRGFQKYELLKGKNVRYSGYAKMDYFFEEHTFSEIELRNLWKIPENNRIENTKRIIIAPHYSVSDRGVIQYSTFHKNLWFLLYLAEKYRDSVSFVLKPHPNLRYFAVGNGLFKSYEDYDDYLKKWDDLSNGKVVQEADYLEYFQTSDAMIMDSGSFLAEYLYVRKPLLYLTRPEQAFLDVGWRIIDSYYSTPGENYAGIEDFIVSVVLQGNDIKREDREKIFIQEYDYKKTNGKSAADYISEDVFDLVSERRGL